MNVQEELARQNGQLQQKAVETVGNLVSGGLLSGASAGAAGASGLPGLSGSRVPARPGAKARPIPRVQTPGRTLASSPTTPPTLLFDDAYYRNQASFAPMKPTTETQEGPSGWEQAKALGWAELMCLPSTISAGVQCAALGGGVTWPVGLGCGGAVLGNALCRDQNYKDYFRPKNLPLLPPR
jgi:hypothetical protein